MGRRPCEQSNIPTVDNSAGTCDEIIPAGCIIVKNKYHNIRNAAHENLDQVLGHINERFDQIDRKLRVENKRARNPRPRNNEAIEAELLGLLNEGNNSEGIKKIVEELFK